MTADKVRIMGLQTFSDAFAQLRQAIVIFVMSACIVYPPVRLSAWINRLPTGRIFMKFAIKLFLENLPRKLKSDKSNAHFTWGPIHICDNISLNSCQNEKSFR